MHRPNKNEATEIYNDSNTQTLLSKFNSSEIDVLEPVYDPKTGYHYPLVESLVGDTSKAEPILNKLSEEKNLIKYSDKVIYCPHCGSLKISFRYCCPFCKSFNIQKSSLIEHVRCGYMDLEENFGKSSRWLAQNAAKTFDKSTWTIGKPESGVPAKTARKASISRYLNITA